MSLQDDIFDVREALKKKPELKAFDRLMTHMNAVEHEADTFQQMFDDLQTGLRAFKRLSEGM